MRLSAGMRVGPYEVTARMGAGGMGELYQARDTWLNRDVALKVLPDTFASDPDRLNRFRNEAHALSALNHPNITTIYEIGHASGAPFIAMELVEGQTSATSYSRRRTTSDDGAPTSSEKCSPGTTGISAGSTDASRTRRPA